MLIRWNEKGRYVQAFLLSPQMFESFHLVLPQARWCACGGILFYWGLMLLRVMGIRFYNTYAETGNWNISRVILQLYGWVYKPVRGSEKALFCLCLFFGGPWIVAGWCVVKWSRNSYLGPAEMTSISSRDISRRNRHDTLWHVVSTGYFYVLFLWAICVSDFRLLEICESLGLPLSIITFTVNSDGDNHFYKYIYLFQISNSAKSVFY